MIVGDRATPMTTEEARLRALQAAGLLALLERDCRERGGTELPRMLAAAGTELVALERFLDDLQRTVRLSFGFSADPDNAAAAFDATERLQRAVGL